MKYELSLADLVDQGISTLDLCLVYHRPVPPKSVAVKIAGTGSGGDHPVRGSGIHHSPAFESLYFYAPPRESPGSAFLPGVTFSDAKTLVAEPVQWPSGQVFEEDRPFDMYAAVRTRHDDTEYFGLVRFEETQ